MKHLSTIFASIYLIISLLLVLVAYIGSLFSASFIVGFWQVFLWVNIISFAVFCILSLLYTKVIFKNKLVVLGKVSFGVGLIILLALNLFVFLPITSERTVKNIPSDTSFWKTEITYSDMQEENKTVKTEIAYKMYKADPSVQKKPNPIVMLHGGPGAFVVGLGVSNDFYKQFTKLGYDVYLYDQTGTGLSARLDDTRDYNYKFLTAELEKIRNLINAEKMVIIGESWGGGLGSNYNAYYPGKVEKIIFLNPVAIDTPRIGVADFDMSKTNAPDNLGGKLANEILFRPRAAVSFVWSQNNESRDAAKALYPDNEADYVADKQFLLQAPNAVCKGEKLSDEISKLKGSGAWSQISTNSSLAARNDDPISLLKKTNTPALYVSTECDFIPEKIDAQYQDAYKNLRFEYIKGAGHIPYFQKFEETTDVVTSFIK